jgi:hypothetical protein
LQHVAPSLSYTVVWRLELFGSVAGSSMGVAHASCNSLVKLRKKSVKEVNECRFSVLVIEHVNSSYVGILPRYIRQPARDVKEHTCHPFGSNKHTLTLC